MINITRLGLGCFSAIVMVASLNASSGNPYIQFRSGDDPDVVPGWGGTLGDSPLDNMRENGISVVELADSVHQTALKIICERDDEILRLAQTSDLFQLEPGQEYELKVVMRVSLIGLGVNGEFRIFVTDRRWKWQTPALKIVKDDSEWQTHTLRFETPEEMEDTWGRLRIQIRSAAVEAEIAEISILPIAGNVTAAESADEPALSVAKPVTNHPTVITLETLEEKNLLTNGTFQAGKNGFPREWSPYPADTSLVRLANSEEKQEYRTLEMHQGAAILGIHSALIPVEPETAYSLALEIKQEDIHIGFNMGGRIQIRWFDQKGGRAQPHGIENIDGSFDWRGWNASVISPSNAKFAQITLTKHGSPGSVLFRNVRFARGTLERSISELTTKDFISDSQSAIGLDRMIQYFVADKHALELPKIQPGIQEISAEIEQLKQKIVADAKLGNFHFSEEETSEVIWSEMLKGKLGFQVRPDSPYYEAWRSIANKVNEWTDATREWIHQNNKNHIMTAMKAVYGNFSGYGLGIDSPMLKVLRDEPYTGTFSGDAKIELARNEEESVQVTLSAVENDLLNISLEVTALLGPDGAEFPQGALSISRIDYVKTNPPEYQSERVGWWPDIVFPSHKVSRIPKGTNQSFWVTVSTDGETPSGTFQGDIVVKRDGMVIQTLPLNLRVWDITLPKPGHFKVVGRFAPNALTEFYGRENLEDNVIAEWNRYIFNKRWNTTDPFVKGLTPNGAALSAAMAEGMNCVSLLNASQFLKQDRASRTYTWPDGAHEEKIISGVRLSRDQFRAAGESPETTLYVFGFDEQHDVAQYGIMKHVFDLVKSAAPEVRTITTTTYSPLKELIGSVDTWVPILGHDSQELKERRDAGDEMFFYIYAHPFHPFPNASLIDYPGIEGRLTFWMAAEKGYTGFLHWLMNGWKANSGGKARWPDVAWLPYSRKGFEKRNGEGYFLYPGPDGQPISSVRFELIRDGIEDWELFNLLRLAIAQTTGENPQSLALENATKALASAMSLVPELNSYSFDMSRLMEARRGVAEALIALQAESASYQTNG